MAVEVKQVLEREFDLNFSMKEIRALTINSLKMAHETSGDKEPSLASADSGNESLPSVSGEIFYFYSFSTSVDIKFGNYIFTVNDMALTSV